MGAHRTGGSWQSRTWRRVQRTGKMERLEVPARWGKHPPGSYGGGESLNQHTAPVGAGAVLSWGVRVALAVRKLSYTSDMLFMSGFQRWELVPIATGLLRKSQQGPGETLNF